VIKPLSLYKIYQFHRLSTYSAKLVETETVETFYTYIQKYKPPLASPYSLKPEQVAAESYVNAI